MPGFIDKFISFSDTNERGDPLASSITVPICSSCGRPIPPHERGVKFRCPNCG
ncbi:MAG: hypothetical protein DRJ32_04545, partial [Thermoprotei archaeon]